MDAVSDLNLLGRSGSARRQVVAIVLFSLLLLQTQSQSLGPAQAQAQGSADLPDYSLDYVTEHECDQVFTEFDATQPNYFSSDGWNDTRPYSDDEITQCMYRFVAAENQHVSVKFLNFTLHGDYPRCRNDYVDVYTDVPPQQEVLDLVDLPLHGRYCGDNISKIPLEFVSSNRSLIIVFYKDGAKKSAAGFRGTYRFFNSSAYGQAKRDTSNNTSTSTHSNCRFLIDSSDRRTGMVSSPNYPGVYTGNLSCTYLFRGRPGERVKLSFLDFDLFFGGINCPYDYVKVFDGASAIETDLIGTYCGQQNFTDLFSSGETMLLEFSTKSGRLEPLRAFRPFYDLPPEYEAVRRGFQASYRFGNDYVDIRNMENPALHVRGTECDVLVQNSGQLQDPQSTAISVISSPNYPDLYPPDKLCRYYLQGKSHRQHLEKVEVNFLKFSLPRDSSNRSAICDRRVEMQTNRSCRCDNGYLAIFMRPESPSIFNYNNISNANHVFCGTQEISMPNITTDSKSFQMVLVLNTSGVERGRFQLAYRFEVDFLIPGVMKAPRLCHFIYRSATAKSGQFNSPRYGMRYPDETTCTYEFIPADRSEQVRINFQTFHVTTTKRSEEFCDEDYVELAEINEKDQRIELGRYCEYRIPGPIVTSPNARRLIIVFSSDSSRAAQGFQAQYIFSRRPSNLAICGGEILSSKEGGGGVITTPNYPYPYGSNLYCDWVIKPSNPNNFIVTYFSEFNVEGSIRSCAGAVMRIYTNSSNLVPAIDKCGTDFHLKFFPGVSQNWLRVRFITGNNVKGRAGFKFVWTEVMNTSTCEGFRCRSTGYCIDHRLECNSVPNCGAIGPLNEQQLDNSDENETSCKKRSKEPLGITQASYSLVHVALGLFFTLLLIVGIVAYVFYHRNRYQQRKSSGYDQPSGKLATSTSEIGGRQRNETATVGVGVGAGANAGMLMNDTLRSYSRYSLGNRSVSTGRKLAEDGESIGNGTGNGNGNGNGSERLMADFPPPSIYNDVGREFTLDHTDGRSTMLSHGHSDQFRRRANGRGGVEIFELDDMPMPVEPTVHARFQLQHQHPHPHQLQHQHQHQQPQRVIVKEKLQKISIV